jgi:type IV secretory pathway ATPase VirB11/archaellum biosynthesis ATPase
MKETRNHQSSDDSQIPEGEIVVPLSPEADRAAPILPEDGDFNESIQIERHVYRPVLLKKVEVALDQKISIVICGQAGSGKTS